MKSVVLAVFALLVVLLIGSAVRDAVNTALAPIQKIAAAKR